MLCKQYACLSNSVFFILPNFLQSSALSRRRDGGYEAVHSGMSSDGGYSMPTGGYYMPTGGYGMPKGGSHGYSMRSGGYGRYRGGSGSYRAGYGSYRGGYGNHYNGSFGGGYGMDYDAGYYGAYNAPMQVIQNPPPGYGYGGGTPATVPMRQGQVPAQSNAVAQPSPHGLPLSLDECAKLVRNVELQ